MAAKKMPSHADRKARHTVFCVTGFSAPFCFGAHTPGKGGMYREPDRFHYVGAAVPGGVHYTGGSRRVFAAAAVAADVYKRQTLRCAKSFEKVPLQEAV